MAEPLSVAASIAGLISLGIQVTQSLVDFYNVYKSRDSDLVGTTERLESLLDIFQCLEKTLSDRNFQADEQSLISNIETSIKDCDELIQELRDECEKFSKAPSGIKHAVKLAGRRATYPFRKSTLEKLDEDIGEIRGNLSSALDLLQLKDTQRIQDDVSQMKDLLNLVRADQISSNLRDWLKAPDATIDHNAACARKHPGTGMGLVKSSQFARWLTQENSIMLLNGFAGSGKSVLCSTAVQFVLRHRRSDPKVGIAFFYFTFNDKSKQDVSAMLRALLLQLSSQLKLRDGYTDLARLYESYKAGTPPLPVLIEHLQRLIQRFFQVYIMLDALDECPRNGPREDVLDALETMQNWGIQGLHLFVTSRDEPDIRDSLDIPATQQVTMQNAGIDKDIADFISGRLDADRRLRHWLPYRDKIQETLAKRAKGVFRWVECQFKSLQSCPCSEDHLDHLLNSLPQSLDETYERMLCNIDHYVIEDARRILTLLCFAPRPLTVREIIDGMAVNINNSAGLNRKRRLQNSNDICKICIGFIEIGLSADPMTETRHEEELTSTVRIAHFSIQEYLESERIRLQKAAVFGLTSSTAHGEIAQICLTYLLEHDLSSSNLDQSLLEEFPLARFAAMYWYHHYQNTANHAPRLKVSILKLFQLQDSFTTWVKLHDMDKPRDISIRFHRSTNDIPAPVYYVSLLGLDHTLHDLIDSNKGADVNAQGGKYGNALQAASFGGHDQVMQMLLDRGADINAQGGHFGNALQAASSEGHDQVVQMLLDRGADANAQGGGFGNALQEASFGGHDQVVQMLLDRGADANAQGGGFGNALQEASFGGHDRMVQMLLDRGADVNAQGGKYGNALQAASFRGHDQVVQMLLDREADVNAQGGGFGNALQAASFGGHDQVLQMLLDRGADVNAQGGEYGNALQAASFRGHERMVQMLLDRGADVNTQGGKYGNALQTASLRGHDHVVQMLLDRGADVNAQGGEYGNALQTASFRGHDRTVRLLLNHDAVVNRKDIQGRTPFHLASAGGQVKIAETLSSFGLDPTIIDTQGRNCLHHAASGGSMEMVKWLLKEGFDPNFADRDGWTSLHWAAKNGSVSTIEILKAAGASSTVEAIEGWTPDSIAIFHDNMPSTISNDSLAHENAKSELAEKGSIMPSTAVVESIGDEHKVNPGIRHEGCFCDGCYLVSFDLESF